MRVANAVASGKRINRFRQLHAIVNHAVYEPFGKDDTSRLAEKALAAAIRYVGPVLEKNTTCAAIAHDIQTPFQTDEIFPGLVFFACDAQESFGALARSRH